MRTEKLILLFGFYLTFCISTYSQKDTKQSNLNYNDGYVIMESGDTIFGRIEIFPESHPVKVIQVIVEDQKLTEFDTKDVKAFNRGEDFYVKRSFDTEKGLKTKNIFFRLINNGEIKLLSFTTPKYISGYTSTGGAQSVGRWTSSISYYLENDGQFIPVKKRRFKKNMIIYFSDDEEIRFC